MPYATYRFNKIIAAETIRFIVTVAIVVYKGLKLVVYRMLTVYKGLKLVVYRMLTLYQFNHFVNSFKIFFYYADRLHNRKIHLQCNQR